MQLSAVPVADLLRLCCAGEMVLVCVPGRRRAPDAAVELARVLHDVRAGRLTIDLRAAAVGRDPYLSKAINALWSSLKLAPLVGLAPLAAGRTATVVAIVSDRLSRCRLQLCLAHAIAEIKAGRREAVEARDANP